MIRFHALNSLVATLLWTASSGVTAEVGVWGTGDPIDFYVDVPANQVMVVTSLGGSPYQATPRPGDFWRFAQGTNVVTCPPQANPLWNDAYSSGPTTFALYGGPMTVELQVSAPRDRAFYLAYQIVPMAGVETVFLSPAVPLHNISVPAGKSLRILSKPEGQRADITIEGVVFHNEPLGERMFSGGVLEGPAELTVLHIDHLWTYTISYTMQDAAVVTPPPGVISAEGLHAVTVEHSSDVTDWSPAAIILNAGDPQSFYRLKAPE